MDTSDIGRPRPRIDVQAPVDRPPDEPRYRPPRPIPRPTAASKPHREHQISELLRHRGRQLSQASRPDAKNMAASKVTVAEHALQAHARPRVGVRQPEAHLMGRLRLRHVVGRLTVCWDGRDVSWAAVAISRPCSSSWHSPLRCRGARERLSLVNQVGMI